MIVPNDDVGVIPVSVATPSHVPSPPTVRTVRPRLGYVSNAELIGCRNDLQSGSLLPRSPSMPGLPDGHILERTRSDVLVIVITRAAAPVLVLVESVDQRGFARRVS